MGEEPGARGVLVGIEVHQQLSSETKLFCSCPPRKTEEFPYSFERRLRPAQSELGHVDPAAVFEFAKGRSNAYMWSPESSCLVEADEEPPHPPSAESLEAAMVVATMLGSWTVDEVHVMRKIVIDGSNTSGFQRTMVVGLGGRMKVGNLDVGVQSVSLEEDAARILGEDASSRRFALDRLGVPLVEVALDPVPGEPELVGQVALHLGRVLRSTGRVARGLGTIRQDLNVSCDGGRVVEVKGVQKLNLVPKVVEYESRRQRGLIRIGERVRGLGAPVSCSNADVSGVLSGTKCAAIGAQLSKGGVVVCLRATGLKGLLGWEPYQGVRLGREVAEVARANSLGGVVHSDEFERQEISKEEEAALVRRTGAAPGDAMVLLAGPRGTVGRTAVAVAARLEAAADGVPAETRAATEDGETRYMRPRPGSQRMYPETDIPVMVVTRAEAEAVRRALPEGWESRVERYVEERSLSRDLALKVYDADAGDEFEELCKGLRLEPSVIASMLVELPVRLSREGVPERALSLPSIVEVLRAIDDGRIAKEAAPDVLRKLGAEGGATVSGAIESLGLGAYGKEEVEKVIDSALASHESLVLERGEGAFSPVMGEVMKQLRGRADGALVGAMLREKLALRARERGKK